MTSEGARKAWITRKRNERVRSRSYSERAYRAWETRHEDCGSCSPAKIEQNEEEAPKYTPMMFRKSKKLIALEARHRMLGELLLIAKSNHGYFKIGRAITEYLQDEINEINEEICRLEGCG